MSLRSPAPKSPSSGRRTRHPDQPKPAGNDTSGAEQLLDRYARAWTRDASSIKNFARASDEELYALLAARASDPQEAFGTPADRFNTKFDPTTLPKGPSVFEVGKRIFLRCAEALRLFLCAPGDADKKLRNRLKAAFVSRKNGDAAIIAGGLVAVFGIGPAVAAIVAALLIRIVVIPTVDVLCDLWNEKIKEAM